MKYTNKIGENKMSRNLATAFCDCGLLLQPVHSVSKPMKFEEYIEQLNLPHLKNYLDEYADLIVSKVQCPNYSNKITLSYDFNSQYPIHNNSIQGDTREGKTQAIFNIFRTYFSNKFVREDAFRDLQESNERDLEEMSQEYESEEDIERVENLIFDISKVKFDLFTCILIAFLSFFDFIFSLSIILIKLINPSFYIYYNNLIILNIFSFCSVLFFSLKAKKNYLILRGKA